MTTRYRLLDTVDWPALHGKRFTWSVDPSGFLCIVPLKAGEPPIIIAQAIRPKTKPGANGQPAAHEEVTSGEETT